MTTAPRRPVVPVLIPLLIAATLLMGLIACLLGGSPLGVSPHAPNTAPTDGAPAPVPITAVVIDPGHGGEDGGASSATGLAEKKVNLAVSLTLRDLLEAAGVPVVMTRTEDVLLYDRNVNYQGRKKVLDLAARRLVAEKTARAAATEGGTALFVSIHMNAFPQARYSGMQVWYGTGDPRSAGIAEAIQRASTVLMPENRRRIKAAGSSIYLLDRIQSPAVLVECGFLSNPAEAERLAKTDYQKSLAVVIFSAVVPRVAP